MTTDDQSEVEPAVGRRNVLRGGAALAGAAGLTVAGSALGAPSAQAADGAPLVLGQSNDASSTTSLTIGGGSGSNQTALMLTNANGPSLSLNALPADWNGALSPGQIANTVAGPLIGVVKDGNNITTQLLTEQDVWLPFILPTPMRLVDTRTAAGRERLTLPSPLASDGRLPAGRSMTFWIAPAGQGFGIPAIHLNITVDGPQSAGYIVVYPGPDKPDTSTVNFVRGQTVANSTFIGTSTGTYTVLVDPSQPPQQVQAYLVSVFTTAATWIIVDGTGAYATGFNPLQPPAAAARSATVRRTSPATLAQAAFGKL